MKIYSANIAKYLGKINTNKKGTIRLIIHCFGPNAWSRSNQVKNIWTWINFDVQVIEREIFAVGQTIENTPIIVVVKHWEKYLVS